ncbi:MAG: phytoene/squalene synthase family protein [Bryobacterales bacterium]|nr:phytoene/squalene synthase family protein [Bryobacterales bacterium]
MDSTLAASYAYCRQVARRRARNFYYSFLLLPRAKRQAMCAVYAFMRYCDDLSDEPDAGGVAAMRRKIARWRGELEDALDGRFGPNPAWPAVHDTVRRFSIPHAYFYEMIDGVSSDLEPRALATFDELYRYCYQVASVVGLSIVHIFGFDSGNEKEVRRLAERCGIAFQLTNILRDVKEDLSLGRVYLPREDLDRFGVDPSALRLNRQFVDLMRFEVERARQYYRESAPLVELVDSSGRASLRALIGIYSNLLDRIELAGYDVLNGRIRLSAGKKLWIALRSL